MLRTSTGTTTDEVHFVETREQANNMSFWAPLHQAAYWRAPVDVVRKLIDLGASRALLTPLQTKHGPADHSPGTLRSRWSDYTYLDMTPLELAHEFEASELYDILSPVIRHPVPTETLALLETQFHSLIRADLGAHVENHRLYLPVLEVLTELRDEPMWFPIKSTLSAAVCLPQSITIFLSSPANIVFLRVTHIN